MKKTTIFNFSKDFFLSFCASVLSSGVMQLAVYPQLAISLTAESYGLVLTIMGYVNIATSAFGSNLQSARLVLQSEYDKKGLEGDFQFLLLLAVFLSCVITLICGLSMDISNEILLALLITTAVTVIKSYGLVTFRLQINYKKNLIASIIMAIGYLIGSFILIRYLSWPWIFSLPCIGCIVYICFNSRIFKEKWNKTPLFQSTLKKTMILFASGLISNSTTYLDRLIIYPIIGGESVSVYSTAAFFTKGLSLVLLPITGVLLTYLANKQVLIKKKQYFTINALFWGMGMIAVIMAITLGKHITAIFYPTLIADAIPFMLYASIGVVIGIVIAFSNSIVLAYAPLYWQTVLSASKLLLYFFLGVMFLKKFGMIGFCVGVIFSNLLNAALSYIVGYRYVH